MENEYPIPGGLKRIPAADNRSDEKIVMGLKTYQPVMSDKNVWAFWHSGWDCLKPWCQRNIINWVRRLGDRWTIRVLDDVAGSENHFSKFVPTDYLPDAFDSQAMVGPPQHLSDLLRLPLLYLYGGSWMDVGMILLRHLEDICWRALEDSSTPYEMAGILMPLRAEVGTMLNGFIASKRGNRMIKRWHDVYCKMWEGKHSAEGFHSHPLLAHLPPLDVQLDELNCPPLLLTAPVLGDYLAHFVALERIHRLHDPLDDFNGADYFANNIFLLKAVDHLYYAQKITGWDGRKQYDLLATKIDTKDGRFNEAQDFVNDVIMNSSMTKFSHGPPCGLENLATIWDEEQDSDIAESTFAEYLRYASVHLDQTREIVPTQVEKHARVYKAGVLEPINLLHVENDSQ